MKSKRELIAELARKNPKMKGREIADAVGASHDYVRHVLSEMKRAKTVPVNTNGAEKKLKRLYDIFLAHVEKWIYDINDAEREFLNEIHEEVAE